MSIKDSGSFTGLKRTFFGFGLHVCLKDKLGPFALKLFVYFWNQNSHVAPLSHVVTCGSYWSC